MLFICTVFITCNKNDTLSTSENKYTDEELLNAIKFVGQGDTPKESLFRAGGLTFMRATLGRKSKNCTGFGVCAVRILIWNVYDELPLSNDNEIVLNYDARIFDNGGIELLLSEQPNIDMRHVSLSVEEDIPIFNENGNLMTMIKAKNYNYEANLGTLGAGGFMLQLQVP